jgi:hypothetical protein
MFDFFNDQNDVRSTTGISSDTGISVDSLFCVFVPLSHAHTDEFQRGARGKGQKTLFFFFYDFLVRSSTARPKTQLGINSLEILSLVSICYQTTTTEHTFKFSKEKEKKIIHNANHL